MPRTHRVFSHEEDQHIIAFMKKRNLLNKKNISPVVFQRIADELNKLPSNVKRDSKRTPRMVRERYLFFLAGREENPVEEKDFPSIDLDIDLPIIDIQCDFNLVDCFG